jgi:two-component system response regulator HydG
VRLGSTEQRPADVRVIAATNRDLQAAVKAGSFRQDLYYRLAVFPLLVPPLRERPEDIRATALQLLARRGLGADRLGPEAMAALEQHSWPGNVRELENALSRALVLAGTDPIRPEQLPAATRPGGGGASTGVLDDLLVPGFQLDAFERDLVNHAIVKTGGNKAQAARLLGVTRRRMYSLLESSRKIGAPPEGEGEGGED